MVVPKDKKVYFFSDAHLGAPNAQQSAIREKKLLDFLGTIEKDAAAIFIVGDLFDFWYEYKHVVPKGYVRILGKLASLTDSGIPVYFFVGNHDMWMNDYFQKELNIPVYFEPQTFSFSGRKFYIGHGDGLGPGDQGYKFLKKIFRNPICKALFGLLPPVLGIGLANFLSRKSRESVEENELFFLGAEKEWLMIYSKEILKTNHFDYFIFGHRHVPIIEPLSPKSTYMNLGDWVRHFTYGEFDGEKLELKRFLPSK